MGTLSDFYRVEPALWGERLIPAERVEEATHVSVSYLQRQLAVEQERSTRAQEHVDVARQRIAVLEGQTAASVKRAQQAETLAAQVRQRAEQQALSTERLVAKIRDLIGEKRRLRDALIAKKGLPAVHYRVDVDREGMARASVAVTLDTFPHRERVREALAEARRLAARQDGQVRLVRLDTVAWRAVIQRIIDEGDDGGWPQ